MRSRGGPSARPYYLRHEAYGLQLGGFVVSFGSVHRGPRWLPAWGRLIMANGPAWCSPLKGVAFRGLKPHLTTSCGLLNQNPTWKVLVGGSPVSASNPKI